jgi:23S rRNA (pseudouridine1915-N3)-methyltransferase
MKILAISPGKKHDELFRDAIAEYEKRLSHYADFSWLLPEPGTADAEGERILRAITPADWVVLLDEDGKETDSVGLSAAVDKQLVAGRKRLVFVIGGAYGAAEQVRERANAVWSLGKLTFPHQLARLILVEQLYRAFTISKGGKYHHA